MKPSNVKVSLRGLWRLKPFDASADAAFVGENFSPSLILDVLVNASTLTTLATLILLLFGYYGHARTMFACSLGLTAICAGAEWHAGLKAHALNHLCSTVLYLCMFALTWPTAL